MKSSEENWRAKPLTDRPFSWTATKRLVPWAAVSLGLAGCRVELPPADSWMVNVYHYEGRRSTVVSSRLSFMQGKALADWFSGHREGWEYKIADLAPATWVVLKREGRIVAGINIGESFVYTKGWFRPLSKAEVLELRAIVDPPTSTADFEAGGASSEPAVRDDRRH